MSQPRDHLATENAPRVPVDPSSLELMSVSLQPEFLIGMGGRSTLGVGLNGLAGAERKLDRVKGDIVDRST